MSLMSVRRWAGVPEEIERLADLRDKGVISDKDFQNLKKQLIQGDVMPAEVQAGRFSGDVVTVEPSDFPPRRGLMGSVRTPVRDRRDFSFDPTPSPLPRRGLMGSVKRPPSPISSRNRGYVEVYYCANCNKRVGKTAKFCKNCGLQL